MRNLLKKEISPFACLPAGRQGRNGRRKENLFCRSSNKLKVMPVCDIKSKKLTYLNSGYLNKFPEISS
ncbi:MAG: hypothetical protein ACYC6P_01585 [Ignavibacteriaceae bacterium]